MAACPHCAAEIRTPASICPTCGHVLPAEPPLTGRPDSRRPISVGLLLAGLLGLFLICAGGITAVLFPAVLNARRAAQRSQSQGHLKMIVVALYNYEETYTTLPAGGTFQKTGNGHHAWMTELLPFIDQNDLYRQIDFRQPWDDPLNARCFQVTLPQYLIPGIEQTISLDQLALSHYAGNSQVLLRNTPLKFPDVRDGLSHTLLAGEAAGEYRAWGDPANTRDPALGINSRTDGFGSPFPGGANFVFLDGSVRFLNESLDPRVLEALATPGGGEPPPSF